MLKNLLRDLFTRAFFKRPSRTTRFGGNFQHPIGQDQLSAPVGAFRIRPIKPVVQKVTNRIPSRMGFLGRRRIEAPLLAIGPHDPARDRNIDFQSACMRMGGRIDRRPCLVRDAGKRHLQQQLQSEVGLKTRVGFSGIEGIHINVTGRKAHDT
ncbi:hypothetical protein A3734_15260 [Sulfitobacter sp. HI0054]|nr:hypothetical protein A3734_15260 [Sulfitobacter sp. HI0054]